MHLEHEVRRVLAPEDRRDAGVPAVAAEDAGAGNDGGERIVDFDFRAWLDEVVGVDNRVERAVGFNERIAFFRGTCKFGRGVRAGREAVACVEAARRTILETGSAVDATRRKVAQKRVSGPDLEAINLHLGALIERRAGVVGRVAEEGERTRRACSAIGFRCAVAGPVRRHAGHVSVAEGDIVNDNCMTHRVRRYAGGYVVESRISAAGEGDVSAAVDISRKTR